jgi:hypothetical protein
LDLLDASDTSHERSKIRSITVPLAIAQPETRSDDEETAWTANEDAILRALTEALADADIRSFFLECLSAGYQQPKTFGFFKRRQSAVVSSDQLWVLDSAVSETFNGYERIAAHAYRFE